jgi:hypothetical protein
LYKVELAFCEIHGKAQRETEMGLALYRHFVVLGGVVVAGQPRRRLGAGPVARLGTDYRRSLFHQIKRAALDANNFRAAAPAVSRDGGNTLATSLCRNYEVRVFGSKAILQLELWRGTMALIDFDGHRTDFPQLADGEVYPSQAPTLNFVDAILGKSANGSPGDLGLAAMEIIEAACESAQTNRCEKIREVGKSHSKKSSGRKTAAVREDA